MFFLAKLRAARETSANMGKEMGGAELEALNPLMAGGAWRHDIHTMSFE